MWLYRNKYWTGAYFLLGFALSVVQQAYLLNILSTLSSIKLVLSQIGPILSAIMFVIAGIFYAVGQMLPYDKKASFHSTAINIIVGAVIVGALSAASTSLSIASAHLLSNSIGNYT